MRNMSVKKKIMVLLTLLMGVLTCLLLVFMLFIGKSVAEKTAMGQLTQTVKSNLEHIEVTGRTPNMGTDFSYYHNGVSTLIYSQNGTLIAGQLPVSFTVKESFESGVIRESDTGKSKYLVLDMWIPGDWDNGVWIRGLMEAPDSAAVAGKNLVENGFKYGKPDGHVWIAIHQKQEEILLTVRDGGIGIPEEEQERIWQRFYQVDPARSEEEGAGLGLSIVEQIARIHGGYMSLESRPGEGSSFTLHLPMD